jgi:hypothetical protein
MTKQTDDTPADVPVAAAPTTPVRLPASAAQAERERKAKAQHDAWVAKADDIAKKTGVKPVLPSTVDFRIAYAKTLRPNG